MTLVKPFLLPHVVSLSEVYLHCTRIMKIRWKSYVLMPAAGRKTQLLSSYSQNQWFVDLPITVKAFSDIIIWKHKLKRKLYGACSLHKSLFKQYFLCKFMLIIFFYYSWIKNTVLQNVKILPSLVTAEWNRIVKAFLSQSVAEVTFIRLRKNV